MINKKTKFVSILLLVALLMPGFFVIRTIHADSEPNELELPNVKVTPYKSGVNIVNELKKKRTRNSKLIPRPNRSVLFDS